MRRTIRSLVVGLGMTVMLGAPVSAGTSDSRYFERAHVASASNETCRASADPDFLTCEDIYVKVYSGRSGGTEPGSRFAGYTFSVDMSKTKVNEATGQKVRQRDQSARVENSDALRVTFDRLRGFSVDGSLVVKVRRCENGDCERRGQRRIEVDLDWTAGPDPAAELFEYRRSNRDGCEFTSTFASRERDARMVGLVDGRIEGAPGRLTKLDLQETMVCG